MSVPEAGSREFKPKCAAWIVAASISLVLHGGSPLAKGEVVELPNGGFEAGLSAPWGTGQYSEGRPVWWRSGNCLSSAEVDARVRKSGKLSLHIINRSPRAPNVF